MCIYYYFTFVSQKFNIEKKQTYLFMKNKLFLAFLFISLFTIATKAQEKKYKVHTVAFYNLENLFDTINGTNSDEEYLPQKGWTLKKYKQKTMFEWDWLCQTHETDLRNSPRLRILK